MARRLGRKAQQQRSRHGEVAGCDHTDVLLPRTDVDLRVVGCRQAAGADDNADAARDRGEDIFLHDACVCEVDKHVRVGGIQRLRNGGEACGIGPRDARDELQVRRRLDGLRDGAPGPARDAGDTDANHLGHMRRIRRVTVVKAIHTAGLTKRYGETLALDRLDLDVEQGEVYGYLGPNGAGKTTTIRLLLGLHRPTSGRADLFGVDAWGEPVRAHARVAYVSGEPFLWPSMTTTETLEFLARLRGGTDLAYRDQLLERFQLDPRKKVRALSKGNRQKVQLIAALATRADLLLLDEPTSGLDPLMEMTFRETIREAKERGQTIFLSSHILSEVEALCDRVGILRVGQLVDQGTLEELRHLSAQTVDVTFGGPAPELAPMPGVRVARAGPAALRFEVTGSIGPVIEALAGHPVASLTSREPSLEEIFLHHYDASDGK